MMIGRFSESPGERDTLLDSNCDGEVDLSEYLTYILFEHQEREIMFNMSKPVPYSSNPKEFSAKNLSFDLYIAVRYIACSDACED